MEIYNENETYTLHFMFSYKYSTYQIFMDTCNEKYQNNISSCEETRYMIQDYLSKRKYIQVYI